MGTTHQDKNQEGRVVPQKDSNLATSMDAEIPTPVENVPRENVPRRSHHYHCRYNPVRDHPPQNRRNGGVRRARRTENLNFLLGLVESEEGAETVDFCQLMEPTVTAFSELFMQHEKMKIWNDFINHTEEEQERLLTVERCAVPDNDAAAAAAAATGDEDEADGWEYLDDKRTVHPAFSPEDCYKRIDSRVKAFLRKRHVPRGTLEFLEADVISFFQEWPTSVLVSKLNSSFERMLLHALCQYLDLKSHSFNSDGERQTEVENKHDYFAPPEVPLTQYLDSRRGHLGTLADPIKS